MGGLAVLFGTVAAWSFLRPDPQEPPQPVFRQVLSTDGWAGLGVPISALAPDGSSMILPLGSSLNDLQLGLKMRGSTEITPIPGTEGGGGTRCTLPTANGSLTS